MALQKTLNTDYGIIIQNAYLRIEELSIIDTPIEPVDVIYFNEQRVRNSRISFSLRSYADNEQAKPINTAYYVCDYVLSSEDNPIKQGYMYLKSLPEFEDAVDV